MKRLAIILIGTIVLAACGSDNRFSAYDIIHTTDPFDERAVIEEAMEEQKDIRKLGFLPDYSEGTNAFDLWIQYTLYNNVSKELRQTVNYAHDDSETVFNLHTEKNTSDQYYKDEVSYLIDREEIEHETLTGAYGKRELHGEEYYGFVAKEDETFYFLDNSSPIEDGYDGEFTKRIAESLKTEEDGAQSYFYDRFSFDLDHLVFPLINEEYIDYVDVAIYDIGSPDPAITNKFNVQYMLEDESTFAYRIMGKNTYENNAYTLLEEEETEYGVSVKIYEGDEEMFTSYVWEKNDNIYSIDIKSDEKSVSKDTVYAIIDSTEEDDREFANKDIFTTNEAKASLNEIDQEILDWLRAR